MTCKIDRVLAPDGFIVLRVSGRIDCASAEVLQELTEIEKTGKGRCALDLTEVTVVSLEAVRTLNVAESSGIELRNCPAYIREWISREGTWTAPGTNRTEGETRMNGANDQEKIEIAREA